MQNLLDSLLLDSNKPTQHWEEMKHQILTQTLGSTNYILPPAPPLEYEGGFYDENSGGELLIYVPVNQDLNYDQESRKLHAIIIVFTDADRSTASIILHWSNYLVNIMENVDEDKLTEVLIQPNKPWWFKETFAYKLGDVYDIMLKLEHK